MTRMTVELCEWFAACDYPAADTQDHPILGPVPICARCLDWYERQGGPR